MGPLLSLFGGDAFLTVLIALVVVVILIVLGVWALKLVFNATGRASRGRAKRLAVVDASPVDQKRQLVLVRRDNVEHLLLIGGNQDLVVESSIFSGPPIGRPRPSPQPQPQPQPAQMSPGPQAPQTAATQPVAPPPSTAAPVAVAPVSVGPARVRGTNLPPDLVAARSNSPGRGSMRHSGLFRPNERQEPDVFPSPPQEPSVPPADSDMNSEAEPVPNDAGAGSDQPDYRDEPQIDRDGDDQTREAHKDN